MLNEISLATYEECSSILSRYWSIDAGQILLLETGQSTINYLVRDRKGQEYVLRNAGSYESYVVAQIHILNRLSEGEFSYNTPRLLETNCGQDYLKLNDTCFMAYPYLAGEPIARSSFPQLSRELGRLAGEFHRIVADLPWSRRNIRREKHIFDTSFILASLSAHYERIQESQNIDEADLQFRDELHPRLLENMMHTIHGFEKKHERLTKHWCHADISPENVLTQDFRITGLLDFGGIYWDSPVLDIQCIMQHVSFATSTIDSNRLIVMVEGFEEYCPLSKLEKEMILPMMLADLLRTICWIAEERWRGSKRIVGEDLTARLDLLKALWAVFL